MQLYEFRVLLDRVPGDDDVDAIMRAGLDDSLPGADGARGVVDVSRHAESVAAAIATAVDDVRRAGFRAVGLEAEDALALKTIAERVGRSYESVRLLAAGRRGPGGFPPPLTTRPSSLYSWDAVARWFREHYGLDVAQDDTARTLAAADHLLRARALLDPSALTELAPLTR